ncbi:MAG: YkgJ family cysteine cluster protein [Calditrichaeota bacterium]|nr:MAG: YkgJ family cysteine cluster protein [Calditrichota bacterium]MBL1204088.1 YkgJ family cysteine cluster protein [Calditrichota bacterium]NOG43919.1 YkgJ family cysteine cluster protein [Calditrichota bacterium]
MPRINIKTPIYFKCKDDCSNCCKISGGFVVIREVEIKPIAKHLKISVDEFLKQFTRKEGKYLCLIDRDGEDCIFLKDQKCSIYPVRPIQCRTFPFWPQNLKTEKRWFMIEDECPGIGEGKAFSKEEIEAIFKGKSVDSQK